MVHNDSVLDTEGAAKFVGAHVETVRRLARRGEIPSFKLGREWRFRMRDLDHWIETHHLRVREPKILVVDDDARVRATLSVMLKKHNYHLSEAGSGEETLALLKNERPDCVLLDLRLPGIDGSEVLKEIRKKYESLPVIIITAYPDGNLMEKALVYAPFMMLPKPLGPKQLLDAIRLVLGGGQSHMSRAEDAPKDNTDFKAFFENAPEYCYVISPDGRILDVNVAALKALGYRKEELVGQTLETIYAPECVPKMKELLAEWGQKGRLENEEMVIMSKTAERRTVLLSASAVRDENGEIIHSVSIQRDISDAAERKSKEIL